MKISTEHLPIIFKHVGRLRAWLDEYCGGADKVPVSLDDVTVGIRQLYGVSIEVRLVRFDSMEIRGFIEIWNNNSAIIYLDSDLNLAMSRYVFVKEACHIMVLSAENATKDPGALIEYYVHDRGDIDARKHPDEVSCEEVTKHGALELLFPPSQRQRGMASIKDGKATLFTIAEGLQLPEFLVEYTLDDHYMDVCNRIRDSEPDRPRVKPARKSM